jgi:aquaporin Z
MAHDSLWVTDASTRLTFAVSWWHRIRLGKRTMKKYLAEALGTAVLVILGCGAAAIGEVDGRTFVDILGIAFAFGLAIVAMAYGIGPVSGCHINPAVTVGAVAAGRMSPSEGAGYIVSQFVGGIVGAGILLLLLSGKIGGYNLATGGLGQNGWGEGYLGQYGLGSAMLAEFIGTFIFVVCILGVTQSNATAAVAGLAIGLTLVVIHIVFINVTGVSVNPARSLGPAIFVGGKALSQVWMFIIIPPIAAACAGLMFRAKLLSAD